MTSDAQTDGDHRLLDLVKDWLSKLEQAIATADHEAFRDLFQKTSYWRDLLALTWRIQTVEGRDAITLEFLSNAKTVAPAGFKIDPSHTPPRSATRVGVETIEAIFSFETEQGKGKGVVRLTPDQNGGPKAWTVMTALDSLNGFEERTGDRRPSGQAYARSFGGPNWLDRRNAARSYEDRQPTVLVVGGGQAGLSIAARLTHLGVDTLIIDRHERLGDNWRKRYHALALHNQVHVNHLPYMPFPPTWPTYIPKDMLALWFEAYAESMELNFWAGHDFDHGVYDERSGCWTATLSRADGSTRTVRPRHIVMATGVSGISNLPDIPSLKEFRGELRHSSQYQDGGDWTNKTAMVIGTGNSGHDIAQDLHSAGAKVTLVQRSPSLIVSVEPTAQLPYALYEEGPPLDDCDLIASSVPFPLMREAHRQITEKGKLLDKKLLDDLTRVGFKLDFGEDDTGWQFKYLTRGGGYCFNVGCSDLIIDGEIGLLQFDEIETFTGDGVVTKTDGHAALDLIVLATGYKGLEALVEAKFGKEVAERVGPIWGFGGNLELRNMYCRTAQPGLWFIAGSFAQCRIYSKYLGLQIKACEEGLLSVKVVPSSKWQGDQSIKKAVPPASSCCDVPL